MTRPGPQSAAELAARREQLLLRSAQLREQLQLHERPKID